ncbi:hypothetical protein [uncultured Ruegeria sp.]|uniref:hypothetical protein n=1 Tax=uncultured Ruegeria sp. TaxID=259304 RepID=UPI00261AC8BE|nr:hypothetical protein [uncultured Ruegeria sp.]
MLILRAIGLKSEAPVYADGKKFKQVEYLGKLFAESLATLTPSQLEAVMIWAPDLMARYADRRGKSRETAPTTWPSQLSKQQYCKPSDTLAACF